MIFAPFDILNFTTTTIAFQLNFSLPFLTESITLPVSYHTRLTSLEKRILSARTLIVLSYHRSLNAKIVQLANSPIAQKV